MITKWTFPIYLGPVVLFSLWKKHRHARNRVNFIIATVLCCLIFIPVYGAIFHYDHGEILSYFKSNLSLAEAKKLEMPSLLLSARGWTFYPVILFKLMTPLLFPVFLISLLRFARRRLCPEIVVTLLGSFLLLSLLPSEVIRSISPLLPLCAIVLATQCLALSSKALRRVICGIIVLLSCWTFAVYYDLLPRRWPLSTLVQPSKPKPLIHDSSLIRDIIRDIGLMMDSRQIPSVCVVPFHPDFRLGSFRFWAYCDNATLNVGPSWRIKGDTWRESFEEADYVITTTGDLGPEWAVPRQSEIIRYLEDENGEFSKIFKLVKSYPLKNGGVAGLYKRRSAAPGFAVIPPGERDFSGRALAIFSDSIALKKFQAEPRQGRKLRLRYQWECLKEIPGSYKIVVHFKKSGNLIFEQDHLPAHKRYPTHFWREGEVVEEEYIVEIPEDAPGGLYQVWVGVWDQITFMRTSESKLKERKNRVKVGEVMIGIPMDEPITAGTNK